MTSLTELQRLDNELAAARAEIESLRDAAHRSRCDLLDEQTRSDQLRAALKECIGMARSRFNPPEVVDKIAAFAKLAGGE